MKKKLLFASLLMTSISFGQIIIQAGDSLTLGDSKLYYRADTSTSELENVIGGNITWDYSGLLMEYGTDSSTNTIIDIASSPYAADIPNAQYHGDFPNGIQSFFTNNGNDVDIEGFVFTSAGVTYRVVYDDDNLKFITRPVALSSSITDNIEGTAYAPFGGSTATADITGTAVTEADGQGVLKIGPNTYNNTLRIKTVENASGQAVLNGIPVGMIALERTSYSYYSTSTPDHFPLLVLGKIKLTIPGGGTVNQKIVWSQDNTENYLSNDGDFMPNPRSFKVFPNPATDNVIISTVKGSESIKIYDTVGKIVSEIQAPKSIETIDVSKMSAGIYFVAVTDKGETTTKKLIVK
ncbi:MAG: T9SS type A sorting domain-containing protein [Crocinitomicaceae bacterium]